MLCLHFRLLGHLALLLFTLLARSVEASATALDETVLALFRELSNQPTRIMDQSCGNNVFAASQELANELEAALGLIVEKLPELFELYADDEPFMVKMWASLSHLLSFPPTMPPTANVCACHHQSWHFLEHIFEACKFFIGKLQKIVELWRKIGSDSFDALTGFLRVSVEALRVGCQVFLYSRYTLRTESGLFKLDQEALAGPDGESGPAPAAARIEGLKRLVCADYEKLVDRMVSLFDPMIRELGRMMEGLQSTFRDDAYKCFKEHLDGTFEDLFSISPSNMERDAAMFAGSDWRGPSEVLASAQVHALWKILSFKLDFPELSHDGDCFSKLFSSRPDLPVALGAGPPSIAKKMERRGPGRKNASLASMDSEVARCSDYCPSSIYDLSAWVSSLYLKLWLGGDHSEVTHEQAKEWLGKVECSLCLVLETIALNEKRRIPGILAVLLADLGSIALDIERILMILCALPRRLDRERNKLGNFLIKLTQVVGDVCPPRKVSEVKSARMITRGPEG